MKRSTRLQDSGTVVLQKKTEIQCHLWERYKEEKREGKERKTRYSPTHFNVLKISVCKEMGWDGKVQV